MKTHIDKTGGKKSAISYAKDKYRNAKPIEVETLESKRGEIYVWTSDTSIWEKRYLEVELSNNLKVLNRRGGQALFFVEDLRNSLVEATQVEKIDGLY